MRRTYPAPGIEASERGDATERLWPDARQELLLHAALAPPPASIDAWRRLGPDLDPRTLDEGSKRLLPLVWSNLEPHGVKVGRLISYYDWARRANRALLDQFRTVLDALGSAGIPTVMLKGIALVTHAYPDMGLRPMGDLDVLVPLARVEHSCQALRALGWTPRAPVTPVMLRRTHAIQLNRPGHVDVDLHWHILEECCRPHDDDDLWAAARPVTIEGIATRIPAPEDQLLHACVHGEKWVNVSGIRWVADAVTLIRRSQIRWDRLVEQAVRRRVVLRLRAQLEYLRSVFDAPIPAEAMESLAVSPVAGVERFEQRWGIRNRRRPWSLVYWCNHVRSGSRGLAGAALTFPRYLQAVWHLSSPAEVPGAALTRIWRSAARRKRTARS